MVTFGCWILDEGDRFLLHVPTRYEISLDYMFDVDRQIEHIEEKQWSDGEVLYWLRRAIAYAETAGYLPQCALKSGC